MGRERSGGGRGNGRGTKGKRVKVEDEGAVLKMIWVAYGRVKDDESEGGRWG